MEEREKEFTPSSIFQLRTSNLVWLRLCRAMSLAIIGLGGTLALLIGYFTYGSYVAKVLGLNAARTTPAVKINDGQDYVPARPLLLLGQHFSAIAAVGPIAGPILAAGKYGWFFSAAWIIVGAIFIGAVHDFAALAASVRHGARSVAEVAGVHIGPLAQKLFLVYIWISLLYVILVFTDLTATAFVARPELGEQNFGPGVATTSLFYLGLAVAMGFLMRRAKISLTALTIGSVLLLLAFIHLGQRWPISLPLGTWQVLILLYCAAASVIPVGTLLQPRGYLGGFLLYACLAAGLAGFLFYRQSIEVPALSHGTHGFALMTGAGIFPFLFTTIACGACSGFHGLVASGTTSKQIAQEPDAKIVGYGGMLLESFVALVALGTYLSVASQGNTAGLSPDEIYARGLALFLGITGLPYEYGVAFGKLAFATFIYDTLDVSTRLGRYIFQELTGLAGAAGKYLGTAAVIVLPALILLSTRSGAPPVWKAYWGLFGASNQLLACLTLAAITVWLKNEGRQWLVTGIPCLLMAGVTLTSLIGINIQWILNKAPFSPVQLTGLLIFFAALVFLCQTARAFFKKVT